MDVNVDIGNTQVRCWGVNILYHCNGFCIMLRDLIVYENCFIAGLFCMHLVKAFTQLQSRKLPNRCLLKHYTRDAKSFVEWDKNDVVKGRQGGNNEQMQFTKCVPIVMGIARAGSKTDYAYEETLQRANTLRVLIETIPANMTIATNTPDEGTELLEQMRTHLLS
jgi:hypothetical protein